MHSRLRFIRTSSRMHRTCNFFKKAKLLSARFNLFSSMPNNVHGKCTDLPGCALPGV